MNDDAAIKILHPLLLGIVCVLLKERIKSSAVTFVLWKLFFF